MREREREINISLIITIRRPSPSLDPASNENTVEICSRDCRVKSGKCTVAFPFVLPSIGPAKREHINYIPDSTRSERTHLIMRSLITLVNVFTLPLCLNFYQERAHLLQPPFNATQFMQRVVQTVGPRNSAIFLLSFVRIKNYRRINIFFHLSFEKYRRITSFHEMRTNRGIIKYLEEILENTREKNKQISSKVSQSTQSSNEPRGNKEREAPRVFLLCLNESARKTPLPFHLPCARSWIKGRGGENKELANSIYESIVERNVTQVLETDRSDPC